METTELIFALLIPLLTLVYVSSVILEREEFEYDDGSDEYLLEKHKWEFIPDSTDEELEFLEKHNIEPFTKSEKILFASYIERLTCQRYYSHLMPHEYDIYFAFCQRVKDYKELRRPQKPEKTLKPARRFTKKEIDENFTAIKKITFEL